MKVPFSNFILQYERMRPSIDSAISRVLTSGQFILDQEVFRFEQEFANYCGAKHAIAVASGTEALQLALVACGINNGDEVITSAHSAVATVAAIEMAGGSPVLVDIDPKTYMLDPQCVKKTITTKTRAIVPVHLYGIAVDLNSILEIARNNDLMVVEDCAQAFGTLYNGRQVGTLGNIGAFSFYPTKNLGAYGDGGAVVMGDDSLAENVRSIRQYGWDGEKVSQQKGFNSRLDEIQAAILRAKLLHIDEAIRRRHELAALYSSQLVGSDLTLPCIYLDTSTTFHLFVVRHPQRDALRRFLSDHEIDTRIHYPIPTHLQKAYAHLGSREGGFPETERICKEVLSLPFYPEMSDEMVKYVCKTILNFQEKCYPYHAVVCRKIERR